MCWLWWLVCVQHPTYMAKLQRQPSQTMLLRKPVVLSIRCFARSAKVGEGMRLRAALDLDSKEYAGKATSRFAAFGGDGENGWYVFARLKSISSSSRASLLVRVLNYPGGRISDLEIVCTARPAGMRRAQQD